MVFVSMAIAAISMTITRALVFKKLRDWIANNNEFMGDLFNCPYCFSHWMALIAAVWYQFEPINKSFVWLNVIVSTFMLVTITSFFCGMILRSFSSGEEE